MLNILYTNVFPVVNLYIDSIIHIRCPYLQNAISLIITITVTITTIITITIQITIIITITITIIITITNTIIKIACLHCPLNAIYIFMQF